MKKSKSTKNKNKKQPLSLLQKGTTLWKGLSTKKKVLLSFAIIVVLSIIIYFSYAWYQGYAFKKVEKKMDTLTQEIVAELGVPLSQSKEQSCGYASAKFSKGQLSCGSINVLTYNSAKTNSVPPIISSARSVVDDSSNFKIVSKSSLEYLNTMSSSDLLYESKFARCLMGYQYDTAEFLSVSVFCTIHPLRPFYEVTD